MTSQPTFLDLWVSSGSCDQVPQTLWLINNLTVFHTGQRLRTMRINRLLSYESSQIMDSMFLTYSYMVDLQTSSLGNQYSWDIQCYDPITSQGSTFLFEFQSIVSPQLWPVVPGLKPSSRSTTTSSTHKRKHSRQRGQYEVLDQAHWSSMCYLCGPPELSHVLPSIQMLSIIWRLPLYWECTVSPRHLALYLNQVLKNDMRNRNYW